MALGLKPLLLASLLAVSGCAQRAVVTGTELQGGAISNSAWIREEVYFGLSRPNGELIAHDVFATFTDREIAARLPSGFTILESTGYWRGANGVTIKEPSRILIVYYRESEREIARAIGEIASLYKRQFAQESVLRVVLPAKITN